MERFVWRSLDHPLVQQEGFANRYSLPMAGRIALVGPYLKANNEEPRFSGTELCIREREQCLKHHKEGDPAPFT